MSLIEKVIDLIRERGRATVDHLESELPHYTRAQIRKAISHGVTRLHLECEGQRRAPGHQGGAFPSFYRVSTGERVTVRRPKPQAPKKAPKKTPIPPASVWELAAPRGAGEHWPPRFEGGRAFQLMWDDDQ